MKYKVVEKKNPCAVHCVTWSYKRALEWIKKYGNSGIFTDKTLNVSSFTIKEV